MGRAAISFRQTPYPAVIVSTKIFIKNEISCKRKQTIVTNHNFDDDHILIHVRLVTYYTEKRVQIKMDKVEELQHSYSQYEIKPTLFINMRGCIIDPTTKNGGMTFVVGKTGETPRPRFFHPRGETETRTRDLSGGRRAPNRLHHEDTLGLYYPPLIFKYKKKCPITVLCLVFAIIFFLFKYL